MASYAQSLKIALAQAGMSQKELSLAAGISQASISQYIAGTYYPPERRRMRINDVLGVVVEEEHVETPPPIAKIPRMNPADAAKAMGMSEKTVCEGLKQGRFPWGYAIHTSEKWTYWINAWKFAEIEGIPLSKLNAG